MDTVAVVLKSPGELSLSRVGLHPPTPTDVVVDVQWSGISTGTERLLYSGRMPTFPGMGYPLVPGYESVGRVITAGADAKRRDGDLVFVPGANCFDGARGLFGGAAKTVVVPSDRTIPISEEIGELGILLALAATAQHALASGAAPELIVGHGALGRLLARLTIANGHAAPTVWETNATRRNGALDYRVCDPQDDERNDYNCIMDVSGDAGLLDTLIQRLAPSGEIVLAGFYSTPLTFSFPPAFMREARLRVAAQWQPTDLETVNAMFAEGNLSLDGLITHRQSAEDAVSAYKIAFDDPDCLKMVLDWRKCSQ